MIRHGVLALAALVTCAAPVAYADNVLPFSAPAFVATRL